MSSPSPPENGFKFPWPFPKEPTKWYKFKSNVVSSFVYVCSKFMFSGKDFQPTFQNFTLLLGLNKLTVENRETFVKLLEDRSKPLITISNHRCTVDDPL